MAQLRKILIVSGHLLYLISLPDMERQRALLDMIAVLIKLLTFKYKW